VPGNIRNADLFVGFMGHVVRYLRERIKVAVVETIAPAAFLSKMGAELGIDTRPLRFAYTRLNSLLRTLQVTDVGDFTPLTLVADFCTLVATYPAGFMVILEPYNSKTPHIPDPVLQLACLDASLAVKPVFAKFASVILTSGTLSPLDMYPKMLNFSPVVRVSLEMSIDRPCIAPLIVARGADQTPVSTRFEARGDVSVVRNYGALLLSLAATVPDGLVAFFPSYSYMEMIVAAWHGMGILRELETHKLLFVETKDIVETTLALNNYKKACDCGRAAIFMSIARGKVAEGIDFDRHYGRCVVLFGIPFQYTRSVVLRARLQYLSDTFHIREQDFLTFDAMRQAAQCIGRIIRSKRDYGVIVFADKRYGSSDKRSKLPSWVLQFLPDAHSALSSDVAVELARKFLREMAQPLPTGAVKGHALLTAVDIAEMQASSSGGDGQVPTLGLLFPAGTPAAPETIRLPSGASAGRRDEDYEMGRGEEAEGDEDAAERERQDASRIEAAIAAALEGEADVEGFHS
jgi:DNA excision repair protein ERCC-2